MYLSGFSSTKVNCRLRMVENMLNMIFLTVCSVIKIPPRTLDEPVFDIHVIVDPVSRGAQKVGPIVNVLRQVLNLSLIHI